MIRFLLDEHINSAIQRQLRRLDSLCRECLYTRNSAAEVRRQLIEQKGYTDQEWPLEETIRVKLNELGFSLRGVSKSRPQKDSPN